MKSTVTSLLLVLLVCLTSFPEMQMHMMSASTGHRSSFIVMAQEDGAEDLDKVETPVVEEEAGETEEEVEIEEEVEAVKEVEQEEEVVVDGDGDASAPATKKSDPNQILDLVAENKKAVFGVVGAAVAGGAGWAFIRN
ncbi:hypothetical protein TrST_g12403 [Triparma strigata]|uniref:Uncharacterized protein n=1 Tax=Triparma strigata TaxID=1606541 RepID=A0A9W6ZZI4_9STRA|nr:hypothetical protein TrST_g12403 [Triparma strigata]